MRQIAQEVELDAIQKETRKQIVFQYAVVFVIALVGHLYVYRDSLSKLSQPWNTRSDIGAAYASARALKGSWLGITDSHLGLPFAANYNFAYPPEHIHLLITRVLINLFQDPFLAVNFQYLLSFGLCGISFFWLAKKYIHHNILAMILSISFAWLPYRYIRFDYGHISLAECFMIPIGLWVVFSNFERNVGQTSNEIDRAFRGLVIPALIVGTSSLYYGIYFSILTFVTIIAVFMTNQKKVEKIKKSAQCSLLSLAFILIPVGNTLWTSIHRTASQASTRSPEESIIFGGSISRLLVPWGVFLPKELSALVGRQEFEWTATPLLVVIGMWIFIWHVMTFFVSRDNPQQDDNQMRMFHFFLMISILCYTTTGLGTIFSYGITPIFRCWNRLSIIISCIGLLLVGIFIEKQLRKRRNYLRAGALFSISFLLFFTQLQPISRSEFSDIPSKQTNLDLNELRRTSDLLKHFAEPNCSILQLPIIRAFSNEAPNGLTSTMMYWIPLMMPDRKWSFGAPAGTKQGEFWPKTAQIGPTHTFIVAMQNDFCGVLIDRRGYLSEEEWLTVNAAWEKMADSHAVRISTDLFYVSLRLDRRNQTHLLSES